MGMLDNLFRNLDDVLKDIEEGGLEKKLDNLASMIDHTTKTVTDKTEQIANAPAVALKLAEEKKELVEQKVQLISREAGKVMDVMPRRRPQL